MTVQTVNNFGNIFRQTRLLVNLPFSRLSSARQHKYRLFTTPLLHFFVQKHKRRCIFTVLHLM